MVKHPLYWEPRTEVARLKLFCTTASDIWLPSWYSDSYYSNSVWADPSCWIYWWRGEWRVEVIFLLGCVEKCSMFSLLVFCLGQICTWHKCPTIQCKKKHLVVSLLLHLMGWPWSEQTKNERCKVDSMLVAHTQSQLMDSVSQSSNF